MSGRTSARSLAGRDQASSPPKKPSQRAKKGLIPAARTRTTRSQSRDLDDDSNMRMRKVARSRDAREGSAESTASNDSNGGRQRKTTRTAPIQDLSIVAEEEESEEVEKDRADVTELSRLSGTTALTTQSAAKSDDLDVSMLVELIPDLSREAFRLSELLIPSNVSTDTVMAVVNELQVPDSGRSKRLRLREKTFNSTAENYGNEIFIDPALVLRKLFNNQTPVPRSFRPEVVLFAANIATLMKELLVAQRDNPNTAGLLQRLDGTFPTYFLAAFESEAKFGISSLRKATFDLALDLRTQTVIATLNAYRYDMNFDPEQILAQLFYELPENHDSTVSTSEDLIVNGILRKIAGSSTKALSSNYEEVFVDQSARLRERAETLREYFDVDEDGTADGHYVDFDELNGRFPWSKFLADVVSWSQLRLAEIREGIGAQGGAEKIASLLFEQVNGSDEPVEPNARPPAGDEDTQTQRTSSDLLPAVTIIPASAGKSLYKNSSKFTDLVKNFVPNSGAPPSNQENTGATIKVLPGPPARTRLSSPAEHIPNDPAAEQEWIPSQDMDQINDNDDLLSDATVSSIAQVRNIHVIGERYTAKENQPTNIGGHGNVVKLKFADRQPNAARVKWSMPGEGDESGSQKDADSWDYELWHLNDDEEDAFQNDDRPVDISRRGKAVTLAAHRRSQTPPTQPEAMRRFNRSQEESEDNTPPTVEPTPPRKKRKRSQVREAVPHEESDDDADRDRARPRAKHKPTSTYSAVAETARAVVASTCRSVQGSQKKRIAWSDEEIDLLLDLIARWGSRWAEIEKAGYDVFNGTGRGQVALRDKARNMKVGYLISGVDLPINFDTIALGKKERDKVKAARSNPYRLEGEVPGQESLDMDGREI